MSYDSYKEWTKEFISKQEIAYPAEYIIRIFKGVYPRLKLSQNSFAGKKILDVGCGDGRNMVLLRQCGFEVHGIEITQGIVDKIRNNLENIGIKDAILKVGQNDHIPYENEFFDYLVSWSSCYYLGERKDFGTIVSELARPLKKDGYLVLQIPKKTCFIYNGCEMLDDGYCIIKNDPFNVRNGEVFRIFEDEKEIEEVFSPYFKNFSYGSIHDDCFGYPYHLHLFVCQKK